MPRNLTPAERTAIERERAAIRYEMYQGTFSEYGRSLNSSELFRLGEEEQALTRLLIVGVVEAAA